MRDYKLVIIIGTLCLVLIKSLWLKILLVDLGASHHAKYGSGNQPRRAWGIHQAWCMVVEKDREKRKKEVRSKALLLFLLSEDSLYRAAYTSRFHTNQRNRERRMETTEIFLLSAAIFSTPDTLWKQLCWMEDQ